MKSYFARRVMFLVFALLLTGVMPWSQWVNAQTMTQIYWTGYIEDMHMIQRANLDGSQVETLVTDEATLRRMAIDPAAGKMYWTNSTDDVIQRANLDGSQVDTLVTGEDFFHDLDLDTANGKIYWTNEDLYGDEFGGKIQRANLDGMGIEDVVTVLGMPEGIALNLATSEPPGFPVAPIFPH